jgi:hypothetical protein
VHKNKYVFQNKNTYWEEWFFKICIYIYLNTYIYEIFQSALVSSLEEESWNLIFVCVFNLMKSHTYHVASKRCHCVLMRKKEYKRQMIPWYCLKRENLWTQKVSETQGYLEHNLRTANIGQGYLLKEEKIWPKRQKSLAMVIKQRKLRAELILNIISFLPSHNIKQWPVFTRNSLTCRH